jgi:WD40 repeat protein
MERVFISYARKDGAALAKRLRGSLTARGFDVWIDTREIGDGKIWTREIEEGIDRAQVVLALMTDGSYRSEICRAEQLRSLRLGKCVIPLMAGRGADVPLHLEAKHYRDFTRPYDEEFALLLADIGAGAGVELKPEYRETYVTAPPLPIHYVERTEALDALRNAVITDDGARHIALTALAGMGGIGKTVLAQALCQDQVAQQAFPDGIIWITVGQEPAYDLVTRMREVGKALDDKLDRYDNELGCVNQYRTTLRKKAALIVVDDIWRAADVKPFLADSPRSRVLFTTRNARIAADLGAEEQSVELLTEEQSREFLASRSGGRTGPLPAVAADVIRECGRLPLALAMIGAMVRGKPAAYWKVVLESLRNAELHKIGSESDKTLFRAIQVSVNELDGTARERYLALAVLLEDMPVPPAMQRTLWNLDEPVALETAERFVELSLAQREVDGIRLHDLQLDYTRAQYSDREALNLIHGALRLSSHVIGKDPMQFASQMVGRLLPYKDRPAIQRFIDEIAEAAPRPWIRPLWPALIPPRTGLVRTLEGHSDDVNGVAINANGRLAVSASGDNTLKVWDIEAGRELRTLQGHSQPVNGVALSSGGALAVSSSSDTTLKVWDVEAGRELRTLKGHSESVQGVAISADGRLVISASHDCTLKVWDVESGVELRSLHGHSDFVDGVGVSADGRLAVSASRDRTLKVWDVESGRELCALEGHSNCVYGVGVSADGRRAISASRDKTLKLWDVDSGRELRTLEGHSDFVNGVAISADGRRAVSASCDFTLKVWDLQATREISTLRGHSSLVSGVAVSADGRRAVSASCDHTLKVWDLEGTRELHSIQGHSNSVYEVAASADARRAVSASRDGSLKVWDVESRRELITLKGHDVSVDGVAVSAGGGIYVSASWDNTIKVWDVESGRGLRTLQGHSGPVWGVAVAATGRLAVSASSDATLKVWDVESGRELRTLQGHSKSVNGVALSADGALAVSASSDTTLKVWDVESGRELHTLQGHLNTVHGVALSANRRLAVSASSDMTLKVWNLESGCELRSIRGHSGSVLRVAVSAGGQHIISASRDRTLRIWNLESGDLIATLTCDGAVYCCNFCNPTIIIAGDNLGRLHFLSLHV